MNIRSMIRLFAFCLTLLATPLPLYASTAQVIVKQLGVEGGINERDDDAAIAENQCTVLKNADLRCAGITRKRSGYTEITGNLTANSVIAIAPYYKLGDSTKRLCYIYDTNMDMYNGTSSTTVFTDLTVSGSAEMFVAGDYLWIISPNMRTRVYNWTNLTQSGTTNTDPPNSKGGIYHQGRVLLWGDTSNLDYLYYSNVGPDINDLLVWDRASNALKIDSGDNQELIAVVEYGLSGIQGLIALKEKSIFYIDTSDATPSNWEVVKLFEGYGCVARRTAVKVNNDVIYLSREGGTYKVMTLIRTVQDKINSVEIPLSRPIKALLDDVSDTYVENSSAIFYNGYYILSFPSSSSKYNDMCIVYDSYTKAWIQWTNISASQFCSYLKSGSDELYFGEDDAHTKIYHMFYGSTDNGTAIDYTEESKKWNMGYPDVNKNWIDMETEFMSQSSHYVVDVYGKIDDSSYVLMKSIDLYKASSDLPIDLPFDLVEQEKIRQTFDLSEFGEGRTFQWRIVEDTSGCSSEFERYGVYLRAWVNNYEWEEVK